MRVVATALLLAAFLLSLAGAAEAEETWTEVRSPHFRVLTDGSGRSGRMVASEFEQMRHVFVLRFGDEKVDSGAPLTIVAARDENTFKELEPALWKARGNMVAGEFHRGWEKQFALVRLDTWTRNDSREVVYHEYTHSILHANAHWLPVWLDEGIAEFYAYTRFQNDHIYVGAPSERLGELRRHPLLPVAAMLEINSRSPYYRDSDKVDLFYAESWALVHYMTFGPGMENGRKLEAFFAAMQNGAGEQKAFADVFGDPRAFDKAFGQYVTLFAFSAGVLPPDHAADPKSFTEQKLTPAQADYELGCFHIGAHDRAAGRALIEGALALDPKLAGAHEELGFLEFEAGKDSEAEQQWQQALALDSTRFRSLFAATMSGPPLGSQTPAELHSTEAALHRINDLAPRFAPAFVELALVEWRLNEMQQAYADARHAEALEPWRAGYHLLTARILLRGNQPAIAENYARYVAAHWFGPDHNEAMEVWENVPPALRGSAAPLTPDLPAAVEVARGTLTNITCAAAPAGFKLTATLAPTKPADAKPLTVTSDGRLMIGFSDTLWWGEDHFSRCYHLAGHPAVLAYKPDGAGGGELVDLEIRDDLPEPAPPEAANKQPAQTAAAQP